MRMNLGKLIAIAEAEEVVEKANHSVKWNDKVTQATKMRIDALIQKCKEKRRGLE